MTENKILVDVDGHWENEPTNYSITICLGEWDGNEEDRHIFSYMDNKEIRVGAITDDGFVIDAINSVYIEP